MNTTPVPASTRRFGCLHVLLVLIVILLVAILGSMWWLKRNVYASEFKPVELPAKEQAALETKMAAIERPDSTPAEAGVYAESAEARRVVLSERELNALIARDPETAKRVAINLADDLVSVKVIAPMEADIPVLGGKTFKFDMGLTLRYEGGQPVVIVRGISLGGIPLPSAWWGDIKNKNLVAEFGQTGGFWNAFARGVEHLEVKDGQFILQLKE